MPNQKESYREILMNQIQFIEEAIKTIKESDTVEFSRGVDYGISFGQPEVVNILKQGIISILDHDRVKARAELARLNS